MKLQVMIVDDDPIFRKIAGILLQRTGIAIQSLSCGNGQEAITLLKQQTAPDHSFLIFLDINMSLMNGWDVLETLSDIPFNDHIHVVIVTSSVDRADKNRAARYSHVIGYMIKPVKPENLMMLKTSVALAPFFKQNGN